jgi:hypothetical protein
MSDFSATTLNDIFEYRDGSLYRRRGQFAGYAECMHHTGYKVVFVKGKQMRSHRVIFAMHHGYLPEYVDHINCIKDDNRIENLRAANNQLNQFNSKVRAKNKSGFKNVCWHKETGKWAVFMRINKKPTWIGKFDDIELADLVATEARIKFHGEFARHV